MMISDILISTPIGYGKEHSLQGFLHQTKWLVKTGRILDGDEISWWNTMNFYLITSQFQAAIEVKLKI